MPAGFAPFPDQGPFLETLGPIQVLGGSDELILGLRVHERHTNHRGTVQGVFCPRSPTSRSVARSKPARTTAATARP